MGPVGVKERRKSALYDDIAKKLFPDPLKMKWGSKLGLESGVNIQNTVYWSAYIAIIVIKF